MNISYYDNETALKEPYEYMFQKVSEKALGKFLVHVKQLYIVDWFTTMGWIGTAESIDTPPSNPQLW